MSHDSVVASITPRDRLERNIEIGGILEDTIANELDKRGMRYMRDKERGGGADFLFSVRFMGRKASVSLESKNWSGRYWVTRSHIKREVASRFANTEVTGTRYEAAIMSDARLSVKARSELKRENIATYSIGNQVTCRNDISAQRTISRIIGLLLDVARRLLAIQYLQALEGTKKEERGNEDLAESELGISEGPGPPSPKPSVLMRSSQGHARMPERRGELMFSLSEFRKAISKLLALFREVRRNPLALGEGAGPPTARPGDCCSTISATPVAPTGKSDQQEETESPNGGGGAERVKTTSTISIERTQTMIPKATENTVSTLLSSELSKLGVNAKPFIRVKTPSGWRETDIYCTDGGTYLVEAKFAERERLAAIAKVQNEYLKHYKLLGIKGAWMQVDEYALNKAIVPDLSKLSKSEMDELLGIFEKVATINYPSIMDQLTEKHWARELVDEAWLRTLGYEGDAKGLLDELHRSLVDEIAGRRTIMAEGGISEE